MKPDHATVPITGADHGIGLAFAQAARARGARKVGAGARVPQDVTLADPATQQVQPGLSTQPGMDLQARGCR
ncbi:MAG: hypothetical protein KGL18_15630 [Burkholderiales bacterium]|nr:hypothetical protein [Burkholderiales bacterium]MDE1926480.1 hypothetical protein [Burkholderiales bacterium]MDE2159972.1 hypothetical protein [Burkholderiales bacterium]MDE2504393.1 hypothetical protein [Burkholderiales bacterium]